MYQYIVHLNYGSTTRKVISADGDYEYTVAIHLVQCPNGARKLFQCKELKAFLVNKPWRYAI
jgi:hypothetical protein